jgi:hypothetical protein
LKKKINKQKKMGQTFTIESKDSNENKTTKLQIRQTLVTSLNFIQGLAIVYFMCQTLVIGYAIVDAGTGGTAVPHFIWVLVTFLAYSAVLSFTRFEVGLYTDTLNDGLYYCYGALTVAIITNSVSVAFFAWEIAQGLSNFYVQSFGFLIATTILTAALILIELFMIGAIWIFQRDLVKAINEGWVPLYRPRNPSYEIDKDTTTGPAPVSENIQKKYVPKKNWGVKYV